MTRRFLESGQREPVPHRAPRMQQATGCRSVARAELRVLFVSQLCDRVRPWWYSRNSGGRGHRTGAPPHLTPSTRELPTSSEVESWVKAVIGLWDDPDWCADQGPPSCRRVPAMGFGCPRASLRPVLPGFTGLRRHGARWLTQTARKMNLSRSHQHPADVRSREP
jgi:hypothetical protein